MFEKLDLQRIKIGKFAIFSSFLESGQCFFCLSIVDLNCHMFAESELFATEKDIWPMSKGQQLDSNLQWVKFVSISIFHPDFLHMFYHQCRFRYIVF